MRIGAMRDSNTKAQDLYASHTLVYWFVLGARKIHNKLKKKEKTRGEAKMRQ
jgi:hypothetical protein